MTHTVNFLQQNGPSVRVFFFCFLLFFFGVIIWTSFFSFRAFQAGQQAKQAFVQMRVDFSEGNFFSFETSFEHAKEAVVRTKHSLKYISYLSFFPVVHEPFQEVFQLVSTGEQTLKALSELIDIALDIKEFLGVQEMYSQNLFETLSLEKTFGSLSVETKIILLQRIQGSASQLTATVSSLDVIVHRLKTLGVQENNFFSFDLEELIALRNNLEELSQMATLLPVFVGLDTPQNFLVLFLNNNELRPAGGFIGSYGLLSLSEGELRKWEITDSYALDNAAEPFLSEKPPEPLEKYNNTSRWFFRDANWSFDFAVSAQQAIKLFSDEQTVVPQEHKTSLQDPVTFDGVIGLTTTFVSDLLSFLGPIQVHGKQFDQYTIADTLEYEVERGYIFDGLLESERKEILQDLFIEIQKKLFSLPLSQGKDVVQILKKNFLQKQLVLYHAQEDVQNKLTAYGFAGRVLPKTTDVFALVDANFASLKSDPVVKRSITYTFKKQDEKLLATLTMGYKHTGTFDWKTTRYRTYVRAYVPQGSKLISAKGFFQNDARQDPKRTEGTIDFFQELDLTVFGGFTSVEPGQTQEISFEFLLPESVSQAIENNKYDLTVLKQIGSQTYPLTLHLDFDKEVMSANPAEEKKEWGDDVYVLNTNIDQDKIFSVELK